MFLLCSAAATADDNWPEFRGPTGQGHVVGDDAAKLPLKWSEMEHVKWKTAIHDRGWSTPVVWGDQIWLTTATEDGRKMYAVCVDKNNGKIIHDLLLFENASPEPLSNPVNCYASPSPVIEAGRVYVHFGSYGTACLDTATGKTLWQRRDLPCRHFRGPGSSPILFENTLILTMDGIDVDYVIALDKLTGSTVWKTNRSTKWDDIDAKGHAVGDGDFHKAYSTPTVFEMGGRLQMMSVGAKSAFSYDPRTGKELWSIRFKNFSVAPRPVIGKDRVYFTNGHGRADLYCVKADGTGDVTDTHVVWKYSKNVPLRPSVVLANDLIFMVDDSGVATCLDAKSGAEVWKQRLGTGWQCSASLIDAAGRLYVLSQDGRALVLQAGREFKVLAENKLDDGFMASPAVSGKALILRTKTALYRVEE